MLLPLAAGRTWGRPGQSGAAATGLRGPAHAVSSCREDGESRGRVRKTTRGGGNQFFPRRPRGRTTPGVREASRASATRENDGIIVPLGR